METTDIVVIGAGLTGLTTAYYLNKGGTEFKVFEKKSTFGGVIQTKQKNGFIYESGPNTGVIGTPEAAELFEDIKDKCELEIANDAAKKRYILKKKQWHALPMGPSSAISTPLFTLKDKFRILFEPFRPRGTNPHETLSQLVLRRMGKSFLDYAIDPFILGVYAGDPSKLIPKYALPKLYNLEQKYGSFIKGSIKNKKEKTERDKKATRKTFSVKGGLTQLTKALYELSGPDNFYFDCSDVKIQPDNGKFIVSATVNGEIISYTANKVITTLGAFNLPEMLPFIESQQMAPIANLKHAKVFEVVVGFEKWTGRPLDGFGGLIPFKENRDILGVLFMSTLFTKRAPEGGALLTVFMGGMRREELTAFQEEEIREILKKELMELMGLDEFKPDLLEINRYEYAIPQYMVDSKERFEAIDQIQKKYPGLLLAGNMRDGIGMADRIKQGKMLADNAMDL